VHPNLWCYRRDLPFPLLAKLTPLFTRSLHVSTGLVLTNQVG
jgi:hypothetical protein